MPQPTTEYLFWVDLETTGLDPQTDKILEIAVIITDFQFNEICRYQQLVSNAAATSQFVFEMHIKSGLADQLNQTTQFPTLQEVEQHMIDMLPKDYSALYYAGSSVHFDAEFIKISFLEFAKLMHHRYFDLSAIKLGMRARNPKFKNKVPKIQPEHRAMNDIRADLNFARKYLTPKWYRRWLSI
jgi:oligoribonuclease